MRGLPARPSEACTSMTPVPPRLTNHSGSAAAEREQHGVRGESRVSDERRLLARIEEPQAQVVIGRGRGRYEGDLGMGELARDARHDRIALTIRVQNDRGRITRETRARERIDLKDSHPAPDSTAPFRLRPEFCTPPPGTLHFSRILGVVLGA